MSYEDINEDYQVKCAPKFDYGTENTLSAFDIFKKLLGFDEDVRVPEAMRVIYSFPATVVFWSDGTKTVVRCGENDEYDEEKGIAMAFCEKVLGNKQRAHNFFKHCNEIAETQF